MSQDALNVGSTLEESQKLVVHWHNKWAAAEEARKSAKVLIQETVDVLGGEPETWDVDEEKKWLEQHG